MAQTIRVGIHGLDELRRDLDAVALGLGREVTAALREAGDTAARVTKTYTPVGPGPHASNAGDLLPHIRDTIAGSATATTANVYSTHPGAIVHEYGGTIAPSGHTFRIRESAMAGKAGQQALGEIERDMERRLDGLLRQHDL
jgi:hypothetical protein